MPRQGDPAAVGSPAESRQCRHNAQYTRIQAGFAAKCGVKTRRINAEGMCDSCNADSVVTAGVKKTLGNADRLIDIEGARTPSRLEYICSHNYIILDGNYKRVIM